MSGVENGNGNLTREVLRAELRAARAEDRVDMLRELDTRLKPINDHISAIDRGEFSPGMKAGVVGVVDERKNAGWGVRSSKAAIISVTIFALVSIFNVTIAIAALTAHHHP